MWVPCRSPLYWELELCQLVYSLFKCLYHEKQQALKGLCVCVWACVCVCACVCACILNTPSSFSQAQHIKNFKSQRWQTLLNFNSQRRLLLTGTPLQNSLMELWSLMHFLMPAVFSSHTDFKEWFSNPLTGMVEGSQEYNASIVKRLHQVCVCVCVCVCGGGWVGGCVRACVHVHVSY